MVNRLREIFNPTPEQYKKQIARINELRRTNLELIGHDCSNCVNRVYVQQSPYYDYITCRFDSTVELPGRLGERHCCDNYRFIGFMEEEE